ncbi:hypothetical protein [Streptomyces chartreusis]
MISDPILASAALSCRPTGARPEDGAAEVKGGGTYFASAVPLRTVLHIDKLAGTAAQKADLAKFSELLSRIKQAERRFPDLPLGAVAYADAYKKTTLPDDFSHKLTGTQVLLDDLLDLSRQQGAAIAGALSAIRTVQNEIDRRTG